MKTFGQLCLLMALISSGYAAFVCLWPRLHERERLSRIALGVGIVAAGALSAAMVILAIALVRKDFSFDYVAHYSSRLLPWYYSLSALWVGQAGSLLLWAWILATLSLLYRLLPTEHAEVRATAYGVLMASLCFLTIILVFAADPMKASLEVADEGLGLSPLLQHPSMLIHPPIVFLSYALWTVPFALAMAALLCRKLDNTWIELARPWALSAWLVLGAGLLLGAHWAYQELGWGGYWGWDPVENGSLLPWLTGTAFVHGLMAWRYRNCLKKTTLSLAMLTFGLCHFATFLTRSGIFSSVHAFSQSPIGWMFLGSMLLLLVSGCILLWWRRSDLAPQRIAKSMIARETLILGSTFLLVLFALVVMVGTLVDPLSEYFVGRTIQVGPPFYNNALIPVGLSILAASAIAPLLRWGEGPSRHQRRWLVGCAMVACLTIVIALVFGLRHPIALAVAALAALSISALAASVTLDARRRKTDVVATSILGTIRAGRRQYAGYVVHLGITCVAIGITGSSLGTQRLDLDMNEGEVIQWSGRTIRYIELQQTERSDKLVAEALLEVSSPSTAAITLRPARHLHVLQDQWTTEVDIHSAWHGDFYTILHAGLGEGRVALTFVDNPLIGWIWYGGFLTVAATLVAAWPQRRRRSANPSAVLPSRTDENDSPQPSRRKAA